MTSNRETAKFSLARMRGQLAALAEDAQHRSEGDDAHLDEQDHGLGVVHDQGSTRGDDEALPPQADPGVTGRADGPRRMV